MIRDRFHVSDAELGHLGRVWSNDLFRRVSQGTLPASLIIDKLSELARMKAPDPCLFEAMQMVEKIPPFDADRSECVVAIVRILAEAGKIEEARTYAREATEGNALLRGLSFAAIFGVSGEDTDYQKLRTAQSRAGQSCDAIQLALVRAAIRLHLSKERLVDLVVEIENSHIADAARSAETQHLAALSVDPDLLQAVAGDIRDSYQRALAYAAIFGATKNPEDLAEARRCAQELLSHGSCFEHAKVMMAIYRQTRDAQNVVAAKQGIPGHLTSLHEQFVLVHVQTFAELGVRACALTSACRLTANFTCVEAFAILYEHFGEEEYWEKARELVEILKASDRLDLHALVGCARSYIALARAKAHRAKEEKAATVA